MPGAFLHGWDVDNNKWVKLLSNAEGKLIIDPSEIFENDPTCDEHGKAPDSDWACEHESDPNAHHEEYTDVKARAAIGDLFDALGKVLKNIQCNYKSFSDISYINFKAAAAQTCRIRIAPLNNNNDLFIRAYPTEGPVVDPDLLKYNGVAYELYITEPVVDTKISDHAAVADAHHERYTDAEAVAAVGYNGTKYWSVSGNAFEARLPLVEDLEKHIAGYVEIKTDDLDLICGVFLPHGALVTSVKVTGNAGSEDVAWWLTRVKLSDKTIGDLATANVNTADTSILLATIDNSLYAYYLTIEGLVTDDQIYGATITYTL